MKNSFAGLLRRAPVWMSLSLVPAFVVTVQAADDPLSAPVYADGRMGPIVRTESLARSAGGIQPTVGTGALSSDVLAGALKVILTPEEVRTFQPAGGGGRESVIGPDTRVRVYPNTYPYRANALVTFRQGGSATFICTAWFYGPDILATAGHCVHSGGPGGVWSTNITVYPGYNAGGPGYAAPNANIASVVGWTQQGNPQYDYGVIDISSNVGNTTGTYGIWWQTASLNNTPAIISGYPGDKGGSTQWQGADIVRVTQTNQVQYKVDTAGGQSGSAVWHDRPAGSQFCANGPCAFAIHAYGGSNNAGTRITQSVYNNLVNWRNTIP